MEKKSIAKNYIYNLLYQIVVLLVVLITTPYLSRVLGAEGIGIYSYTISIVTYFILFGSLGIAMYGQREIAYIRDDEEKVSKTFFEISVLKIISMTISIILFYFILIKNNKYSMYYKILILELISNAFDITWFYQGLEEFKKIITRNLFIKILSVIFVFILIREKNDLNKYLIIYVIFNLLGNLTLWINLSKYLVKFNIKKVNILKHLKPTLALFIPQIAIQIYTVLDKTMIGGILDDMNQVGNYEQSQKIIKMTLTLITSLGMVISPRIANNIANNNSIKVNNYLEKSFRFVWMIGIPIMLGLIVISDSLINWYLGEEYEQAKILLKIGSLLIMVIGLSNVTGMQYLIPSKNQHMFTISVIIGAICNFIFNIILIKTFKAKGAIIASLLAEIIVLMIQIFVMKEKIDIKIIYKNSNKYIISGLIMFTILSIISYFMKKDILSNIIQIIVGGIIYLIMLIILKDKFVFEIKDRIIMKFKK